MARINKGAGGGKKRPSKSAASARDLSDLAAVLALIAGGTETGTAASDLDRAQDKAFDAMEATSRRKRIALAREALVISPLCADAYLILARESTKAEEALTLYRQAVEAGAQALGEAAFEEDIGHFWGLIETRPYMRARHNLARDLWAAGEFDEAVDHYQDMLRLNPNDNQGIRYSLLDALLQLGREKEAGELLKQYKDDASAAWAWSAALLSFRRKGDCPTSREALSRALEANPHVPAYLLRKKPLPASLPEFIGMGDEDEAVAYVHDAEAAWMAADAAKGWLDAVLASGSTAPLTSDGRSRPDDEPGAERERTDEAVLALLLLGLHDGNRAWKTFDWEAMDRLHAKGLISNPASRAKSVVLTEAGLKAAIDAHQRLLGKSPPQDHSAMAST